MRLLLLIAMILANQLQGILGTVHAAETESNLTPGTPPASIDGVTLVSGEKYLLVAQTDKTENGIYLYDGADLVRPSQDKSLDSGADTVLLGSDVFVVAGTEWEGTTFELVDTDATVLDGYENLVLTIDTHEQVFEPLERGPEPWDVVKARPFLTTSETTGGTLIPYDGTLPQISEGTQLLSGTFALDYADSLLLLVVSGLVDASGSDRHITLAAFDGGDDALGSGVFTSSNYDRPGTVAFQCQSAPATTSNLTLSLRIGINTSGPTWYSNRAYSGSVQSTAPHTVLTAFEIAQ